MSGAPARSGVGLGLAVLALAFAGLTDRQCRAGGRSPLLSLADTPGHFAEFEVDLLRMRTREGMAVARAKGKLRGKQPKLSTRQQRELARMAATGEYTIADLAEVFTVSRATVYRPPAIPGRRRGQVTGSARHLAPRNSLKGSGSAQPARYR
jgi:helix-turn-helix resolvase-like protein